MGRAQDALQSQSLLHPWFNELDDKKVYFYENWEERECKGTPLFLVVPR